jgi:hypothetical protein
VPTPPRPKAARPARGKSTKSAKPTKAATAKAPTTRRSTKQAVRSAAARAVEQVMNSKEAFALMMRRLEAAGWQVERAPNERERPAERGEV